MPRQNFISKDFFVNATEEETRQSIKGLPGFVPNVKLVMENKVIPTVKFLYERPGEEKHHHVDVSVLPLTDMYTRVTLHVSYASGHAFNKDPYINNALQNFESAIHAALGGHADTYQVSMVKESAPKRLAQMLVLLATSVSVFFIWKKMTES